MAILSLDEAASALGLTKDELKDMVRRNTIRSFRDENTIKFKSEEIDAYTAKRKRAEHNPENDDSPTNQMLGMGASDSELDWFLKNAQKEGGDDYITKADAQRDYFGADPVAMDKALKANKFRYVIIDAQKRSYKCNRIDLEKMSEQNNSHAEIESTNSPGAEQVNGQQLNEQQLPMATVPNSLAPVKRPQLQHPVDDRFLLSNSAAPEESLVLSQPVDDSFLLSDSPVEEPHSPTMMDTDPGSSFSLLPDDMDSIGIKSDDYGATTEVLTPAQAAKMAAPAAKPADSPFELSNEPTFRLANEEPASADPSSISAEGSSGVFQLSDDSSSEFELGSSSEINVEPEVEADASFELALSEDSVAEEGSASFAIEPGDSSSVFELDGSSQLEESSDSAFDIRTEDSSSQQDGSGSENMELDDYQDDYSSGFAEDIAPEDGSGSQVVLVNEEGDINAGTLVTPSRSSKTTQLMPNEIEADLEAAGDEFEEIESSPDGKIIAEPQPWGVLPVLFLTPAFLVMTALVFLTFEILLSSIGFFQGNKVSTVLLKPMMDIVDKDAAKLLN